MKKTTENLEKKIAMGIIKNITEGCLTVHDATKMAGIGTKTFYLYLDRYNLRNKYEEAKINPILIAGKTLINASKYDWKAALEVLKRKRRKVWGDKQEIKHDGEIKGGNRFTKIEMIGFDEFLNQKNDEKKEQTDEEKDQKKII